MPEENGGRVAQPKMSTRVLLESLGLGQYYRFFQQAGMSMIDGHSHWSDLDVEDILNVIERRTGFTFAPKERVLLWKALRLMWARGPGHDCPFVQSAEVTPLFLPKRDWRQMDSDVKFKLLEPDRQRQVLRKQSVMKGGKGLTELQFEIYIRQQDIFYELKDVNECVQTWMKSDPRKMLREDPREEAMKLRIRTMMDAAAGFLQVRKGILASKTKWGYFFMACRLLLLAMSLMMFVIGLMRFQGSPNSTAFWYASGQFRSGTAFMLSFWVAFLVADRTKEDHQNKRFQRIIISLERLMEEISSFRVESDHVRMEEHEAVQRNESAAMTYEQSRTAKTEVLSQKPKKRRKKKNDEMSAWAPGEKFTNMEEFKLKTTKAIEESFKRLPPLPDNFRRDGGNRMLKFDDRGDLGGVEEHTLHIKAPWQMFRGEPQPTEIEVVHPSLRAMPLPRRPAMPPPTNGQVGMSVPPLQDLRHNALGDTPPYGTPYGGLGGTTPPFGTTPNSTYGGGHTPGGGGWDMPPDDFGGNPPWADEVAPRTNLREAMRSASDSLPGSRAVTHSQPGSRAVTHSQPGSRAVTHSPRGAGEPSWATPTGPTSDELRAEAEAEAFEEPLPMPKPKAKNSRRRGSKDVADEDMLAEREAAQRIDDLRNAAAGGDSPPLPPPSDPD